ncbi:hypothetical protein [Nocardioides rubriscoriae]|uniref:hypothetical protein n=1 Tax=Nocardioides rubriscoriae TaxID=642762 RepID=UPI0011DF6E43|nr:hypothetical protein [Nocardioides rubriscoriae]
MSTTESLQRRRRRYGNDLYACEDPVTATDAGGVIRVTVDAAGDVVDVVAVRDTDALRTPEGLAEAVLGALARAEGERSVRSALVSGLAERAERGLEPPRILQTYRARPITIASPQEARERFFAYSPRLDEAPRPRVSGNGCLTVHLSDAGVPDRLETDPGWLQVATLAHLTKALKETLIR